jgi:hypothetical protein
MKHRALAIAFLTLFVGACAKEPALVRQIQEIKLIDAIRQQLLQSVEAEKSAVLATTDEESTALAQEARRAAAGINRQRAELRRLVTADGRREEIEKLDAFDAARGDLEEVDKRLLPLAVQNTNLKATRLAASEGAAALNRLVDSLTAMQHASADPEVVRELSSAAVAALRVQDLLLVHIPAAEPAEMTRLESQIRKLIGEVDGMLAALRQNPQVSADGVATASLAWSDYQRVAADVLRLSRENSNIVSFDLSVHAKRPATKACLNALAALETAVESGAHATR